MSTIERAEAGTRVRQTETDKANYRGIAKHPLARKWMLSRYLRATERAKAATTEDERKQWQQTAEMRALELRRAGVKLEDRKCD